VAAHSMIEQLFGDGGDITYKFGVTVKFVDGTHFSSEETFSPHIAGWQFQSFTVNVPPFAPPVDCVVFRCVLGALRGAVYFDSLTLVEL